MSAENGIKAVAILGLVAVGGYVAYTIFGGGKVDVDVGDSLGLKFKWMNNSPVKLIPFFRFDIKQHEVLLPTTWQEGEWVSVPGLMPEETSEELLILSIPIPSGWTGAVDIPFTEPGNDIDAKLVVKLYTGASEYTVWEEDSVAHVSK